MTNPEITSPARSRRATGLPGALALLLSLGGCASAFMAGSAPVSAPPPNPAAKWTVTACKDITGAPIPMGSAITYYLEQGAAGPTLYEMDAKGNGAKITNRWDDAQGTHYFTHEHTSHGYELVLPADRKQPGTRNVYLRGAYQTSKDERGIIRPAGAPGAICVMNPS